MTDATLVVVGTPIGNLADWSPRAQEAVASAGLIACEDTRRTGSLLARNGIANPGMVIMNEHTERDAVERVLEVLASGRPVAMVTDAGMPAISDPGALMVRSVVDAGFEVVVVPGPTAASAAVALAGFAEPRYAFEGFLPRKGRDRTERLAELATERRVIVLYESPHRVERTLADLAVALGGDRRCIVARELTKLHETVWRGSLSAAAGSLGEPRGEYVIVIDAAPAEAPVDDAAVRRAVEAALGDGLSTRDASRAVADELGIGRRRVYEMATRMAAGGDERGHGERGHGERDDLERGDLARGDE